MKKSLFALFFVWLGGMLPLLAHYAIFLSINSELNPHWDTLKLILLWPWFTGVDLVAYL